MTIKYKIQDNFELSDHSVELWIRSKIAHQNKVTHFNFKTSIKRLDASHPNANCSPINRTYNMGKFILDVKISCVDLSGTSKRTIKLALYGLAKGSHTAAVPNYSVTVVVREKTVRFIAPDSDESEEEPEKIAKISGDSDIDILTISDPDIETCFECGMQHNGCSQLCSWCKSSYVKSLVSG